MLQGDKVPAGHIVAVKIDQGSAGQGEVGFENREDGTNDLAAMFGERGEERFSGRYYWMSGELS